MTRMLPVPSVLKTCFALMLAAPAMSDSPRPQLRASETARGSGHCDRALRREVKRRPNRACAVFALQD